MSRNQLTLARPATCSGMGVHLGTQANLLVKPAPVDHGIRFSRTDLEGGAGRRIIASARSVTATMLGTTLANAEGDSVATVEHLLAACSGAGLDNLLIEIDGPEVPVMDGSSAVFCQMFLEAGIALQDRLQPMIRILHPVEIRDGNKWARLEPADDETLRLKARIDFADPAIGVQETSFVMTPGAFGRDIGFARTFGFLKDVEAMQSQGFARGGSLENAIVVHEGEVMNPEGLRCPDEFIRHKLLDAIGDLALAGAPIVGRYEADRPGHAMNFGLVTKLLETPSAWEWTSGSV